MNEAPSFLRRKPPEVRENWTMKKTFEPDMEPPSTPALDSLIGNYQRLELAVEQVEAELTRDKLSEIASLARSLTYGEMMELAEGIWGAREGEITAESLPGVLHRWSQK